MSERQLQGSLPLTNRQGDDTEMFELLQRETFEYFLGETTPETGLIADKTAPNSPASIAAVGLGLSVYIVGVENKFITREEAANRTLRVLRFFDRSRQGTETNATGYKGFYYHFLDMKTGERVWKSELSTIDTALLMAGVLSAKTYFREDNKEENEIRDLAKRLYDRVDWRWALNGEPTLTHGWKPESGFLPYRWNQRYSEAMILYVLALGSPTFSISPQGYHEWISTFEWKRVYGIECIYAGPLFIHQLSHIWLDFRAIYDQANRKYGIDYFENSRRATLIQRKYAIENPHGFAHYGENGWGFTASDGPGPARLNINGREIEFYGYIARGAPYGPDDGTISPWSVVTSLPFAPEVVAPAVRHAIERLDLKKPQRNGFDASFNPTFPERGKNPHGWVSPWKFGLNQGPIVLMIENKKSEFIWKLMKRCEDIKNGLLKAGFRGGWLDD